MTLSFKNITTGKTENFYCFHDFDLGISKEFGEKLTIQVNNPRIVHNHVKDRDNDCTTDEDQIRSAIKNVYRSLENKIREEKEADE